MDLNVNHDRINTMKKKKLSIIVPVYNERPFIQTLLQKVIDIHLSLYTKEIIIIDDGSTDGTKEIIIQFTKDHGKKRNVKFIYLNNKKNEGKGSAIKKGFMKASGDIIIIQDADLEYEPAQYLNLIKPFADSNIYAVYGSRTLGIKKFHNRYSSIFFYFGGRLLTLFINVFYGTKLTDQPTGYKVFRKRVIPLILKNIKEKDFSCEIEITATLAKNGYKIIEIPIRYTPRHVREGKKINIIDFWKALYVAIKYLFI